MSANQPPEQIARDAIDTQLRASGWIVQAQDAIDFHAGDGQAVREYSTDSDPADDVLFVDGHPVGVIEAKTEPLGQSITVAEEQAADYAAAKLKWVQSTRVPLPFLYHATLLARLRDARSGTSPSSSSSTKSSRSSSSLIASRGRSRRRRASAGQA